MIMDRDTSTFMIRDGVQLFLDALDGHLKDAETAVDRDKDDIFHKELIKIFSEGKGDFLKRFGWFINEDTELDFEANRVMIDSLLEFANNYKDKADINIIYKLFGEMLETRLYCASGSLDDSI